MLTFPGALLPVQLRRADDPLLVTRLQLPPIPADVVPRPDLVARLDPAPGQRLTCITAPTGYGKTTLLRAWAETTDRPIAWVSLDERDNDPARFWYYVVAAIRAWEPDAGAYALTLLRTPEPPPLEYVVTALVNGLSTVPVGLSLVLDDYHLIADEAIHRSVRFLLDNLPVGLHVVVAGRDEPPLGLPRRRARGELGELRAANLRFSLLETAAFLNGARFLRLSNGEVATLAWRTDGWAAGLRLAALALRRLDDPVARAAFIAGFSGSHRTVVDYLADEVLDRLPPAVLDFCVQTAVLDRLTGPLCDALTGRSDGRQLLEYLERSNGFLLPLDEQRAWYVYQPIFAAVLRERLRRAGDAAERNLHRRAGRWLHAQGRFDDAIAHALAADDSDTVAAVVSERLLVAAGGPGVPTAPPSGLSERELEVLRGIDAGLSNREIAAALFVTVGTVKRHTKSIYSKLDVASRTQAIVRARELRLLRA